MLPDAAKARDTSAATVLTGNAMGASAQTPAGTAVSGRKVTADAFRALTERLKGNRTPAPVAPQTPPPAPQTPPPAPQAAPADQANTPPPFADAIPQVAAPEPAAPQVPQPAPAPVEPEPQAVPPEAPEAPPAPPPFVDEIPQAPAPEPVAPQVSQPAPAPAPPEPVATPEEPPSAPAGQGIDLPPAPAAGTEAAPATPGVKPSIMEDIPAPGAALSGGTKIIIGTGDTDKQGEKAASGPAIDLVARPDSVESDTGKGEPDPLLAAMKLVSSAPVMTPQAEPAAPGAIDIKVTGDGQGQAREGEKIERPDEPVPAQALPEAGGTQEAGRPESQETARPEPVDGDSQPETAIEAKTIQAKSAPVETPPDGPEETPGPTVDETQPVAEAKAEPVPAPEPDPSSSPEPGPAPEAGSEPVRNQESDIIPDAQSGETARMLLDIMSQPSGGSQPQERALASDTLLQLVARMQPRDLVALSERVAMMEDPPPLLVTRLVNHKNPKVAAPLLENGLSLTDQDLLDVVAGGDHTKLTMIARRRTLSRSVSDALIAHGDPSVYLTVARNPGAALSRNAFNILGEKAKSQPSLQAPLATRGDTPPPVAFELFWSLPVELRRYVLSRFLTDSATLDKILKIALAVDGDDSAASPQASKFPPKRKIDELGSLIAEGFNQKAAAMMAELAQIDEANASRIISDPDGEPLSVAFKAMGLSRAGFSTIIEHLQKSEKAMLRSDRNLDELKNLFDSLSFNKARTLLTYWDWAILKTGPYTHENT